MRPVALIIASLAAFAVAPWLGPDIAPDNREFVMMQLRLPRAVLGALVGGSLGLVGAVFQTLFHNPLAAPSTLGTTAGAALGALAILVFFPGVSIAGWGVVGLGAALGAALVTAAIAALAASRRMTMADLLLAGIAISLGSSAVSLGLQVQADAATTFRAVRWSLGSLSTVGWDVPAVLAPVVLVCAATLVAHAPALQTIAAGASQAASQGVDVVRVRWTCLTVGSVAVGAGVAATGPLAFVGLLVPHLVRLVAGGAPRRLLPLSLIAGAGLLPLADGLARLAMPARDLPVGVVTAAIGAPALLLLLLRRQS